MDLEQQLRSLLTDDRLDVQLAPGAVQTIHDGVRRRKRRNAAMSAAASFVLVAGGITTGVLLTQGGGATLRPGLEQQGSHSPKPITGVKPPVNAGDTIPWASTTYNAAKPFALPGTTPDAAVPMCKADQLSLTASEFQGATGSMAGALTLTNNGTTCGVQGRPTVTGYGDGDTAIATTDPDDAFVVHPWFALEKGQQARTSVQIFGDAARCDLGAVKRLTVDIGTGGTLSADLSAVSGGDVQPRCGSVPKSAQLDHYTASPSEWTRPGGAPRLPMSEFTAAIGQQPTSVLQGAVLRYQVLLSTGGATVQPCLPYREQLVSLDGTQTVYGTAYFLMNCEAMSTTPAQGYTLNMQLPLPIDIPAGTYALQWQTPIQGLNASEGQTIRVVTAPPICTVDQLTLTPGTSGAATTHYRQNIVIRNTSKSTCSERGFPGIEFVAPDGTDLPTKNHWVTSSFMWSDTEKELFVLTPGSAVSFALGGVDYDAVKNQSCQTASGIKVIPPGLSDQVLVHVSWPYCLDGNVDASPVVPGTRGPR